MIINFSVSDFLLISDLIMKDLLLTIIYPLPLVYLSLILFLIFNCTQ